MTVQRVSPAEAHALVGKGAVHVDVRTEEEFVAGHPEGALNVPFLVSSPEGRKPNPRFLEVMSALFSKDTALVLGCRSGARSLKAAGELLAAGFTSVVDQRAGWDGTRDAFGEIQEPGWSRTDLPKEDGATTGHTYPDLLKKIEAR